MSKYFYYIITSFQKYFTISVVYCSNNRRQSDRSDEQYIKPPGRL